MIECPIGFICEFFECDRRICNRLSYPWPLPFFLNPVWLPGVSLVVVIPGFSEDLPEYEHELEAFHEYNEDIAIVRQELWLNNWWVAIDIPYESHPEGGLKVIHYLSMDDAQLSSSLWDDRYKREQFAPAVPVDCYQQFYKDSPLKYYKESNFDDDGFFKSYKLDYSDFMMGLIDD